MLQSIINFVIAKELRIIMMHSTEIKSHLESLKSLYQKGLVSVMIGAGFSKNVCTKYPNWNELLSDLVIELYERSIITEYDMRKNSIPGFNVSFDSIASKMGEATDKILEEIQSFFIEYFNKETPEKEKIILKGKKEGD